MTEAESFTVLLQFITGSIIPVVVLYLQRVSWTAPAKFGLAAALSIIVATIMAYIDGKVTAQTTMANFVTILTISQTVYHTFFRGLNLHGMFFPQDVLVNKSKDKVAKTLEMLVEPDLARAINDRTQPEQLAINIDVTKAQG